MTVSSLKKIAASVAIGAGLVSVATPANALFVAHEHAGFNGRWLVNVAGTPSYIDVADNMTSAVENYSGRPYSGRNVINAWSSAEVFYFNNNAVYSYLGGANDIIDHFDRR